MKSVEELERELREAKRLEEEKKSQITKEKNYERFLNRSPDAVIWLAHCEIEDSAENRYNTRPRRTLWETISIHWNCWSNYNANALVTSSTYQYFHNVWSDKQRNNFQKKLNELAVKEIKKIMWDLTFTLELMWLQSNDYYLKFFPESKQKDIEKEIEIGQKNILDKFDDKDFLSLIKTQSWWYNDDWPIEPYLDINLSHSSLILMKYVIKYRPTISEQFKKTESYKRLIKYLK